MTLKSWRILYHTTVNELREATARINRQSPELLRARLRVRRWCRRWRRLRARISTRTGAREGARSPGARPCSWVARQTRYGRIYWEYRHCRRRTLNPSTASEQKAWGQSCPDAPVQEVKCL